MRKEGWQRKWRRLMLKCGLFLPWLIDDIQSIVEYDEVAGMSPEESVCNWINQREGIEDANKSGG